MHGASARQRGLARDVSAIRLAAQTVDRETCDPPHGLLHARQRKRIAWTRRRLRLSLRSTPRRRRVLWIPLRTTAFESGYLSAEGIPAASIIARSPRLPIGPAVIVRTPWRCTSSEWRRFPFTVDPLRTMGSRLGHRFAAAIPRPEPSGDHAPCLSAAIRMMVYCMAAQGLGLISRKPLWQHLFGALLAQGARL